MRAKEPNEKEPEEIDPLYLEEAQDIINQILAILEKVPKYASSMWIVVYAMGLVLLKLQSYPTAITYLQQARTLMLEQMDKNDDRVEEINEIIGAVLQPTEPK
jgi:hypothetical protein